MIRIDSNACPRAYQALTFSLKSPAPKRKVVFKNLSAPAANGLQLLQSLDPMEKYLDELKRAFGHCASFWADVHGGEIIGVKWTHKNVRVPVSFSANLGYLVTPCEEAPPEEKKHSQKVNASKRLKRRWCDDG